MRCQNCISNFSATFFIQSHDLRLKFDQAILFHQSFQFFLHCRLINASILAVCLLAGSLIIRLGVILPLFHIYLLILESRYSIQVKNILLSSAATETGSFAKPDVSWQDFRRKNNCCRVEKLHKIRDLIT